jgi:ABC-type transport system involved in multi-copper enzyme maturation permease subunit
MWKTLAFKELRGVLPIACIAIIAYFAFIFHQIGFDILPFWTTPRWQGNFPYQELSNGFLSFYCMISVAFAAVLGFWQTVRESTAGTWLYLLHHPVSRNKIFATKLAVGLAAYLLVAALPILLYSFWAATPGTHPSPFFWWMTEPAWKSLLIIALCHLGAFLSGIRPGRWFGTRLLPLVSVGFFALLISVIPFWWCLGLAALALAGAIFVSLIYFVAKTRDFS